MNDVLDREALEAWLADHLDAFSGPLFVDRFSGGQSNPTLLLSFFDVCRQGHVEFSNEQHYKAAAALKRRDSAAARAAIVGDIASLGERIHLYLSRAPDRVVLAQVRVTRSLSAEAKLIDRNCRLGDCDHSHEIAAGNKEIERGSFRRVTADEPANSKKGGKP
jgi:hypothetical protein